MTRVVVVHPFVQAYRRALYEALARRLAEDGRELTVVWNTPPPRVAGRQDSVTASWTRSAPTRWITVGGRDIGYRRLGGLHLDPTDLVIVEQALKNIETYRLLLPRKANPRVAMWGHGRTYSVSQPEPIAWLKQWLTRRSQWFFAYTDAGARHVVEHGFPADRVTVVTNTIDTDGLRRDLAAVDPSQVADFARTQRLNPGRTALFLGGVDDAKGIGFLLAAAERAARLMPGFVLLVGGTEDLAHQVAAVERAGGPVRLLGRLDGRHKALALATCDVLAVPQWVGLVAVDSLVAGRPIVSTVHPSHAPEAEYLTDGTTWLRARHDVDSYAHALVGLLSDDDRRTAMRSACRTASADYSLNRTADAFADGIARWEKSGG